MTNCPTAPRSRGAASLLALALPLLAQEPAPTEAPAGSRLLYTVEVQGPAVWLSTFAVTNAGTFLGSEAAKAMAEQVVRPLDATLQQMLALDAKGYGLARARLLDWSGSLVVEVRAFGATEDSVGALFAMTGDGRTDTAAIAADLGALAARADGLVWQPDSVLGSRVLRLDGDFVAMEPFAVGTEPTRACQVAFAVPAAFVERARKEAAELGERLLVRERKPRPALHVVSDLDAVLSMAADDDFDAIATVLGLSTLRRFEFAIGTAGPHVMLEASQTFSGEHRGLFGLLFPDVQTLPMLEVLRPKEATVWKTGHCDFAALDRTVRKAAEARANGPVDPDDLPKALFDPQAGIFAHFTGEYSFYLTPKEDEDDEGELLGEGTSTGFLFRIRDHEGFAPKWKAARKDLGVSELEAETLDGGYVLQRFGGFLPMHCVHGPDLFGIANGRDAAERLRAVVAQAKDRGWVSKEPTVALPAPLVRFAPKGLNGLSEGDVAVVASQVLWAAGAVGGLAGLDSIPDELEQFDGKAVRDLLRTYHLDVARSATGYDQGRWHLRVFW